MRPDISVVIDTFNYASYVTHAVDSVLSQSVPESSREVLVVDDGSVDDTPQRLKVYGDKIRYIRKPNGGQASAFNMGISQARGDLVSFLDADDYFYPNKLSCVLERFGRNDGPGVVYNRFDVVDHNGHML